MKLSLNQIFGGIILGATLLLGILLNEKIGAFLFDPIPASTTYSTVPDIESSSRL